MLGSECSNATPDDSCVWGVRNGAAKSAFVRLAEGIAVERCGKSVQRGAVVLDEGKTRWLQSAFHVDIPMPVRESQYISARRYDGDCAPCSPPWSSGPLWLDSPGVFHSIHRSDGQPSSAPLAHPVRSIYPAPGAVGSPPGISGRSLIMDSPWQRHPLPRPLAAVARPRARLPACSQRLAPLRPTQARGSWEGRPHCGERKQISCG
jgi:hypothetical protein